MSDAKLALEILSDLKSSTDSSDFNDIAFVENYIEELQSRLNKAEEEKKKMVKALGKVYKLIDSDLEVKAMKLIGEVLTDVLMGKALPAEGLAKQLRDTK